jgi:hypothetical protein
MSSQLFERIETTTPNEITRNDLATYTIKSGDRQVPLDRLLTTQGKALEKQAEELFKKDDELEKFKEYLKEEKDANTLLKRRLKEINKNLEKYKSDLNTIDQEKQYVGNKNKELISSVNSLTDEKKRLEAVVTGMSKKDENIKDIRDTYERSLQEHRNHITKLEKALETASKDNYSDIRKQVTEEFNKRDKIIVEKEETITKLRGIVEKNIKELADLNQRSLAREREGEKQLQSFTKQIEMEREKNFHLKETKDETITNYNLALKARDNANTNLQKVIREYQTYRRDAESYKTRTDIEKRELIKDKKQAVSNAREWREKLEATMGGNAYKKPFNDGYNKGLVDGKKYVNQDLINQIDDLKKEKSDLRLDLDKALARELQWGTTMEIMPTATVAKKTKDSNLNTNNITSGTRRTRTTRQPSTLLPRAEQVEQARVVGTRTVVAQQATVARANQTGLQGRLSRLSGLLGRRTRDRADPRRGHVDMRHATARVVADAPGGASNKNNTKKIKRKKSRKERKVKSKRGKI